MTKTRDFMNNWRQRLKEQGWNFGPAAARLHDPEYTSQAQKAQNALDNANFEEDYGVLKYANAELMKFSRDAVPAAQNAVGGALEGMFNNVYGHGRSGFGYDISKEDYFNAYPEQRQMVMNMKLPENPAFLQQEVAPGYTVRQYFPDLANARTGGDLQGWLLQTMEGGLQTQAKKLSSMGQDYGDVLGAMQQGVLESITTYNQFKDDDHGQSQSQQFVIHAGWGAYNAASNYMDFAKSDGLVMKDDTAPVDLFSGVGNDYPEYQPGFENVIAEAQANMPWGAYGGPRRSSMQLGQNPGAWSNIGLQEGDVIPAWNKIRKDPEIMGKALSAVMAGKQVPMVFARRTGASADPNGETRVNFVQGNAYLGSGTAPTFSDAAPANWLEGELSTFRHGGGVSGTTDYEYQTGMFTKPGFGGKTTFNYKDKIWVSPLSPVKTDEFSVPATIKERDIKNMGRLYEMGMAGTEKYKGLQQAVKNAQDLITGRLPSLGNDLEGFGAADHFNDWITSLERRHSGNISGTAYELVDPESELERERRKEVEGIADPASTESSVLNNDPELGEYYGHAGTDEPEHLTDSPMSVEDANTMHDLNVRVPTEAMQARMSAAQLQRQAEEMEIANDDHDKKWERNRFFKKDPTMARRLTGNVSNNKHGVTEVSEDANSIEGDVAYDEAIGIGYSGDISGRFMNKLGDTGKTPNLASDKKPGRLMTDNEVELSGKVFAADKAAKKQVKDEAKAKSAEAARQQTSQPQPARPTGPSHIEAHGYNGPVYGGGMGNRIGGGIGMGGPIDPESGMGHMNVDDPRHLHSHNVTGGSGVGNNGSNGNGGGNIPSFDQLPPIDPNTGQPTSVRQTKAENLQARPTDMQEGWRLEYEDKRAKQTRYAVWVENPAQPTDPNATPNEPGWYMVKSTNKSDLADPGERIGDPGYGKITDAEGNPIHSASYGDYQLYAEGERVKQEIEANATPGPNMAVNAHIGMQSRRSRPNAWGTTTIDPRLVDATNNNQGLENWQKFNVLMNSSGEMRQAFQSAHPGRRMSDVLSTAWNAAGISRNMRSREDVLNYVNETFPYLDEASAGAVADTILAEKGSRSTWSSVRVDNTDQLYRTAPTAPSYDREELRTQASQRINLNQIADYNSKLRGEVITGPNGELQLNKGGVTWLTQGGLQQAVGMGARAVDEALGSPLPQNPNDAVATFEARVADSLNRQKKASIQELENSGLSPELAKTVTEFKEDIAKAAISTAKHQVVDKITDDANTRGVPVSKREAEGLGYSAVSVRSADQAKALAETKSDIRAKIAEMGTTPEELAAGKERTVLTSEEGEVYAFGGEGYGGSGPRVRGGLWGGKMGAALYGAYLMKRLWSMSAAPGIQESQQYLTGIGSEYDRWLGMQGQGSGISTRMALEAEMRGQAASEIYGGFSEGSYLMGQVSPSLNRMGQYAGLAGGLAGGAFMGIGVLGQMGMLPAGLGLTAASAGPVGLAVGGTALAAGAGMELENQLFFGGRGVMTPGNLWHGAGVVATLGKSTAMTAWDVLSGQKNLHEAIPYPGLFSNQFFQQNMTVGEIASADALGQKVFGVPDVDRVRDLNQALAVAGMENPEQTAGVATRLDQIFGGKFNQQFAQMFGKASLDLGLTSKENLGPAEQYAAQMGYQFGTAGYQRAVMSYGLSGDVARQNTLAWQGGRVSALGLADQLGPAVVRPVRDDRADHGQKSRHDPDAGGDVGQLPPHHATDGRGAYA